MKRMALVVLWAGLVFAGTVSVGRCDEPTPVKSEVTSQLTQALAERRVVTFVYKGHARTVEPHALGKGTDDKPVLLGWQTGGGSQSEPPPGWRVFLLTDIGQLTVTETTFAKPRPDYHKGGRGLVSIDAEVAEK
jgi:hypothetical protein